MAAFPVLYSRTSTGAIQQWQIKVYDNQYWSESGQVDGKIVISKPTAVKGKNTGKKNATTDEQQAEKDAQSKFDKQLKTGYFLDINEIDNLAYIQPTLAKSYKDRKNVDLTLGLLQCKFNGGRCVARKIGLFTRTGEAIVSVPHIANALAPFFEGQPDTAFLDGELFNEELRQHLNEIMKLIRRNVHLTQEHFDRSEKLIKFYVYDGYGFNGVGKETPYIERKAAVDVVVAATEYLEYVETIPVHTEEEMWEAYDVFIAKGHEGGIVRFEDKPYDHSRSEWLLKLKPTDDAEYEIVDVEDGTGNWSGIAKRIYCKTDDGRIFKATFKGNMTDAKTFLDEKDKYIGKKYTFFYNGMTGKGEGLPNYAQFDYANSVEDKNK
jgi:DNA ligase-1